MVRRQHVAEDLVEPVGGDAELMEAEIRGDDQRNDQQHDRENARAPQGAFGAVPQGAFGTSTHPVLTRLLSLPLLSFAVTEYLYSMPGSGSLSITVVVPAGSTNSANVPASFGSPWPIPSVR